MAAIGDLFSFIGQFVDQRTRVILEIIKHAATQCMTWSARMIKLVKDFWRQGQMSSGPPEDVVGGLPGIVGEEERIIVFDGKDETSTKKEETIEAEEDEMAKKMFVSTKTGKAKKAHNGVRRSSKKKGAKSRAAYSLRGVSGEGDLFSFIGQFVDQRTRVILKIIKHAATLCITWSARMIKLVNDFWRQGQTSSGPPEDVVGGLPGIVGEEERIIVLDDKEETSIQKEETIEAEEDEMAKEMFVSTTKTGKAKKAHNGVRRSSKKKGAKSRAAYSLRGVSGEVQ
eukprot:jgi/Undpi1/7120/HiC_scaffold_22.g09594.m1